MVTRTLAVCVLTALLHAQDTTVDVKGETRGQAPDQATVELRDYTRPQADQRTVLAPDGSFEFVRVPQGQYEISIEVDGQVLARTSLTVRPFLAPVVLTLPENRAPRPAEGSISLRRLTHKPPKAAMKEFRKGNEARKKRDLAKAVGHWENAVALDPDFFEAHTSLGGAHLIQDRYERAVESYERALALEPGMAHAHSNLAMALCSARKYDRAIISARKAVQIDGAAPKPRYILGLALMSENPKSAEAAEHFTRAIDGMPRARLALAQLLISRGESASARRELSRYLEVAPAETRPQVEAWIQGLR